MLQQKVQGKGDGLLKMPAAAPAWLEPRVSIRWFAARARSAIRSSLMPLISDTAAASTATEPPPLCFSVCDEPTASVAVPATRRARSLAQTRRPARAAALKVKRPTLAHVPNDDATVRY